MCETSADVLNIVKAVSIFMISVVSSWAIYYIARTMKELFKITKETRGMLNKVEVLIDTFKEKIDHSASYLLLMSEGVKKLVEVIGNYTSKKEDNKKD